MEMSGHPHVLADSFSEKEPQLEITTTIIVMPVTIVD
jgi:hypothetical protein